MKRCKNGYEARELKKITERGKSRMDADNCYSPVKLAKVQ
jgi:hypothetical protein